MKSTTTILKTAACAWAVAMLAASTARAQVFTLTKEQLIEFTKASPFERFPNGRPKVPDALLERAKLMSMEDVWNVLPGKGYRNQYEGDWQVLHPGMKMVGRAFTVQFLPARPDMDAAVNDKSTKENNNRRMSHQFAIDQLQPGDVLVVDMWGKKENSPIIGDNLFYYIMKATKGNGIIVDGALRDLEGLAEINAPAYFRSAHPTAITGVTVSGINVPIRIGNATVMPGDLVVADREGIYFIPPQLAEEVLDRADETRIHDEWTKKKFDEGKYKSSEIYSSPRDPELRKEYQEYLKTKLEEIKKSRAAK
ncbi:MAG: dimethylmenaquinone methyltransferase [Candidatus Solibacter sp.]